MGKRLTRTEMLKRQRNDARWGNPSGDPEVRASDLQSTSFASTQRVSGGRGRQVRVTKDRIGSPSTKPWRTENQKAWDK